jgi:hypothetical protein
MRTGPAAEHSCKTLCPSCSDKTIAAEIKVHQRWALLQHSCKPLCILSFHFTARQLECGDAALGCQLFQLPENEL